MLFSYILIFLVSCALLFWSGNYLVGTLTRMARFLGWKEFVVAFFIMSFATSIPNLFVGVISALNKVPEISFADIVGANIIDLSLVMGLAALISKAGLSAPSRTVQGSSIFTIAVALLPLILIQDSLLSRADGILLLIAFGIYLSWLFTKRERFEKTYDGISEPFSLKFFFKNIFLTLGSVLLLFISAQGIVKSAVFFADYLKLPLSLIGILIIGLGTSLPEISFVLHAARKSHDWLILGNLMGSVVMTTTLVLGVVALIYPIQISDFSPYGIARVFLIISALFFLFFIRTQQKITRKEAVFLLGIYIAFLIVEILTK